MTSRRRCSPPTSTTTGSPELAVARTVSSVYAVLQATLESGERELRLVAAQDAIASPAASSRCGRSGDPLVLGWRPSTPV